MLDYAKKCRTRCLIAQYVRVAGPATRVAGLDPLELVFTHLTKWKYRIHTDYRYCKHLLLVL